MSLNSSYKRVRREGKVFQHQREIPLQPVVKTTVSLLQTEAHRAAQFHPQPAVKTPAGAVGWLKEALTPYSTNAGAGSWRDLCTPRETGAHGEEKHKESSL